MNLNDLAFLIKVRVSGEVVADADNRHYLGTLSAKSYLINRSRNGYNEGLYLGDKFTLSPLGFDYLRALELILG